MDKYDGVANLSPTRGRDRKIYREALELLTQQLGDVTMECDAKYSSTEYSFRLTHPLSGFSCFFAIMAKMGSAVIVHWCPARGLFPKRRLANTFAGMVNPHHRQKATDVSNNLVWLITSLSTQFLSLTDGTAFLPDEVYTHAAREIEKETQLVNDVCSNAGQLLANVKHTKWLLDAVVDQLREDEISKKTVSSAEPAGS